MTEEQETVLMITGAISELPPAQRDACKELAERIRKQVEAAGEPVGGLAIALVGAEMAMNESA